MTIALRKEGHGAHAWLSLQARAWAHHKGNLCAESAWRLSAGDPIDLRLGWYFVPHHVHPRGAARVPLVLRAVMVHEPRRSGSLLVIARRAWWEASASWLHHRHFQQPHASVRSVRRSKGSAQGLSSGKRVQVAVWVSHRLILVRSSVSCAFARADSFGSFDRRVEFLYWESNTCHNFTHFWSNTRNIDIRRHRDPYALLRTRQGAHPKQPWPLGSRGSKICRWNAPLRDWRS